MESIAFNGVVLTNSYHVFARRGMPYQTAQTEAVPGRDGVLVLGADYTPPSLSLVFVLGPCGQAEMMQRIRALAAVLDVREPRPLYLGDDGGLYYMAMPSGERDWVRHPRSGTVEVPFLVRDAAMYGAEKSISLPSGGSVTFTVGGTYPTYLTRSEATSVNRASDTDKVWGISLDDGEHLRVSMPSSSRLYIASMDFGSRVIRGSGSTIVPITLDSDWLQLTPGEHTLTMDKGTTTLSVMAFKYRERWL